MSKNTDSKDIIEALQKIADQVQLEKKAYKSCKEWLNADECDLPKAWIENIKITFSSHKLCFKHKILGYPFIDTRLDIFFEGDTIGYYRLISLLDGEPDDDYFVIYDEFKNR